jgi:hypothetical protein
MSQSQERGRRARRALAALVFAPIVLVVILVVAAAKNTNNELKTGTAYAPAPAAATVPKWKRCSRLGDAGTTITGKVRGDTSCLEGREVAGQWLRSNDGQRPKPRVTVAPSLGPWYCVADYSRQGRPRVACRIPQTTVDYRYARVAFTLSAE